MAQYSENDIRNQFPGLDIEAVATALNGVATALGENEPYVTAETRGGRRTFTVNDEVAGFVQTRAQRVNRRGNGAANGRDTFGF